MDQVALLGAGWEGRSANGRINWVLDSRQLQHTSQRVSKTREPQIHFGQHCTGYRFLTDQLIGKVVKMFRKSLLPQWPWLLWAITKLCLVIGHIYICDTTISRDKQGHAVRFYMTMIVMIAIMLMILTKIFWIWWCKPGKYLGFRPNQYDPQMAWVRPAGQPQVSCPFSNIMMMMMMMMLINK